MPKLLVTGSDGLIGRAVTSLLRERGHIVCGYDLRRPPDEPEYGDITDYRKLAERVDGCVGIIHLAAVSRVAWGETDPERCRTTNIEGTRNVLRAARASSARPWVLFASSREVYGEPAHLPVTEDSPLRPVNIYGRSKLKAEELVTEFRQTGLNTAIVRLANAYGSTEDHDDRVVPAVCRAAAEGAVLHVRGRDHQFDFVHIQDVAEGMMSLITLLQAEETNLPPVHLVTGCGKSLGELARLAIEAGGNRSPLIELPARAFEVHHFVGDPGRAQRLLGWHAAVPLADGVARLVSAFQQRQPWAAD